MAFHHRHLPTFTRFTKMIVWKWMHLYWPMMIHYLTDKYEGRMHHLIVDTIYAVVSFICVAANIGLALWFYLYFTPAHVELNMLVDTNIKSGEVATIHVQYSNYERPIKDARIHVNLPEGFVVGSDESHRFVDIELGDIPAHTNGSFKLSGIVYGNIDEAYTFDAEMNYQTVGRDERIRTADRFFINDSAFSISAHSVKAAAYDLPVEIVVEYKNTGRGKFNSGRIHVDLPDYFEVTSTTHNDIEQSRSADIRDFELGDIEAGEQGVLFIRGVFHSRAQLGDQVIQMRITPYVSVHANTDNVIAEFEYASTYANINIIRPYADISVVANHAYTYGSTVKYTVTVKNTSATPLSTIALFGHIEGLAMNTESVRINGFRVSTVSGYVAFPRIEALDPGESIYFSVTVPTHVIGESYQYGTLTVFGDAYAQFIDQSFDLYPSRFATRFASVISIASSALYYGPSGEYLGYGPNPPIAWNVTGYRIFLRLDNGNQPVSQVRVSTTLPGMTTWTGSYSTSTGALSYDPQTRKVIWTIPELPADARDLGAQFEVRFLPNHLQIGLRPHIINDLFAEAFDPFAHLTVTTSRGAVVSVPILP